MNNWGNFFNKTKSVRSIYNNCVANQTLIDRIIENTSQESKVLELGCGTAVVSIILADYIMNITATDIDSSLLDSACLNVPTNKKIKFEIADLFNLKNNYKKNEFEAIYHKGVMEHFSDHEIIASLKDQIYISKSIIFSVPNINGIIGKDHFGDERLLSRLHWLRLIKAADINNVKVYGELDFQKNIALNFIPYGLYRKKASFWWKFFSKHYVFVCKK